MVPFIIMEMDQAALMSLFSDEPLLFVPLIIGELWQRTIFDAVPYVDSERSRV